MEYITKCILDIFNIQKILKTSRDEYHWRGLGNLIGDYGECWAINHFKIEKAPKGTKDYDAYVAYDAGSDLKPRRFKIQIKTMLHSRSVGIRGSSDYLIVVSVDKETAVPSVFYEGPCPNVESLMESNLSASDSWRDNKIIISGAKLRKFRSHFEQQDPSRFSLLSAVETARKQHVD